MTFARRNHALAIEPAAQHRLNEHPFLQELLDEAVARSAELYGSYLDCIHVSEDDDPDLTPEQWSVCVYLYVTGERTAMRRMQNRLNSEWWAPQCRRAQGHMGVYQRTAEHDCHPA